MEGRGRDRETSLWEPLIGCLPQAPWPTCNLDNVTLAGLEPGPLSPRANTLSTEPNWLGLTWHYLLRMKAPYLETFPVWDISLGLCSSLQPPIKKLINSTQNEIVGQFGSIYVRCHLTITTYVAMSEEQPYHIKCYTMNKKRRALSGKMSVPKGKNLSKLTVF